MPSAIMDHTQPAHGSDVIMAQLRATESSDRPVAQELIEAMHADLLHAFEVEYVYSLRQFPSLLRGKKTQVVPLCRRGPVFKTLARVYSSIYITWPVRII